MINYIYGILFFSANLLAHPIVIAHRGASGYLPEHTLESASLAYGLGAHFIEPDVVLTKDSIPIILHDIHLEDTTDVTVKFPDRARNDGRWYAADLTLQEIKSLRVHERTQGNLQVFPQRFPSNQGVFLIPTLQEMIDLVTGLNYSRQHSVGLYIELKSPKFHEKEGKNIAQIMVDLLKKNHYEEKPHEIFIQCFDPETLKGLRFNLKVTYQLIQLIGENSWEESDANYDAMRTKEGLKLVSQYAHGVGPWLYHLAQPSIPPVPTSLVDDAHNLGLLVHPYTLRKDDLPSFARDFTTLHALLFKIWKVDGAFTDFPDITAQYIRENSPET